MDRRKALPYLMAAPGTVLLIGFVIVPLLLVLFISFQTRSVSALWQNVWTLENYRRALADPFYLTVMLTSTRVALLTTLSCALIGFPLAYHLARMTGVMRGVLMFLVLCPLLVSTVIRSFGWLVILGDKGLLNSALTAVGLSPRRVLYTETAVVIGLVHFLVPFMTLPLMAAIERVPRDIELAARNLGASPLLATALVVVPLSVPGFIAGSVIVFTLSLSAVVTPLFLGGRETQMIGPQIFDNVLVTFNWPFAGALTSVVVLIAAAAVFVSGRQTRPAASLSRV
jgi:putative spermidine/putrescine transport system permease protein